MRFRITHVAEVTPAPAQRIKGLGDVVAKVAEPIRTTIRKVFPKFLENCGGCDQRREKMNDWLPFK